jgi:two-component system, cell cycle response regulator DivK
MPDNGRADEQAVIMIVEDNDVLHKAYREILEVHGYRTISAMRGGEALRLARQQRPSLVLLDIMLPDILGWEVQHRLAGDPLTEGVPVVGISAIGDRDAPSRALQAGFAAFLPKPVRIAELVGQVEALLHPSSVLPTEI